MQNEEENVERGKSDEHFDKAEIQSAVMRDEERESHVLGEEEETENDNLEKTQQIDDFGSKKTEKQEVDEQLDRTSKSGEAEKETTDDDGVGLSKVQGEIGEGLEAKIAETETNAEQFESDKLEAHEIDKMIHEVVEKKEEEEENAKVGEKNEDIKLQEETKEEHSKGKKEMVEEKTPEAETNIANDIPMDTLRKTCDEGEEKKSEKMEMKHGEAKEEVDARIGEGFIPKIAETETKAAEFEVEKIRELVENKEENAKVGTQREDNSLIKLQENEEEFQGQKRHEKIQELVEEQTPKAETNTANDTPKPYEARYEGEDKNQGEEYKEKITESGKTINDANAREVQEIIRQQDLEKESKTQELVKSKTNEEEKGEKEIAETKTKEQEFYRPKVLEEQEKIQELAEKKTQEEEEEIAEFCEDDDDDSLEEMMGQEEKDKIPVAETIAENDKSKKFKRLTNNNRKM